jgi:polyribonucleotide nucleotidyltransferase
VQKVSDVLTEGQQVKVKVIGVDDRGKVKLSMRLVDQETGEELPDTRPPREPREGGERSDRGPRRDGDRGPRRDGDRGPRRDGGRDGGRDRGGERGERRPRREAEPEGDGSLPAFLTGNDD